LEIQPDEPNARAATYRVTDERDELAPVHRLLE
jgi:hypothetical protein